ncbi:MAG: hypothetical protein CVU57_20935 [Deltaproteobacteria bacterium HGW-Deltaproteobacteria-15]|jgi:hypothetical protein|nr:MAG: hypothetical protein CVU57_20935 [Deltaproteobacteria bacterium HGW-Deltaproteobacteria-15]PKN99384.1 MAG: hypothetical protein CVU43_15300 [Chloroflexi bacterium HGW-Chloroflexi-5]
MRIGEKEVIPPFDFWIPDFTDFTLPLKEDGSPYKDPDDYDAYLDWLVVHLEENDFPLKPHQSAIMSDPNLEGWDATRLGLWIGGAAVSGYYFLADPQFEYPEDFLFDPRPDRVCDPQVAQWSSTYWDDNVEEKEGMIDLQTHLIFDFLFWEAEKEYRKKRAFLPKGTTIFSDVGWRPLLKEAVKRTANMEEKRKALRNFHDEFAYLCMK